MSEMECPSFMSPADQSVRQRSGAMTTTMYLVGGKSKKNTARLPAYEGYEKGVILALSENGEYLDTVVEYESPPEVCPETPSVLFKAASLVDGRLYACTETEILVYRVPEFTVENYISLPIFNDLHHVTPSPSGSLFVACAGLDAVFEISQEGEVLREWELFGGDLWSRFDKATDYRRVASTKPHQAHPNFVFLKDGEVWVTRCDKYDAMRLFPSPGRIPIEVELPHDGIVFGPKIYFTTVDGHVVRADFPRLQVDAVYNLQDAYETVYPLGWCRGLRVLDEDRVIVGFSRLRPTPFVEKISWVKRKLHENLRLGSDSGWPLFPTRIACIDLSRKKILWETHVERYGMNAVFSIL
jgi:hypothetical protein